MTEALKVYIKGVPGRGDEVIKILTDLGGKESNSYLTGANKRGIYYIQHNLMISFAAMNTEMSKIIMDNYKEIKLSEQWKNGDILINTDGTDYKVFWKYDSDSDTSFYAHNVSIHINGTLTTYSGSIWHGEKILCFRKDYRLATPSEAKRFHELLNKCGKDWDAEKKQLVDWKWKPNERDYYYYISSLGNVIRTTYLDTDSDKSSFDFGNCFRTEEEANTMAEKIKKLLKGES